jgi:hypothetical protein
MALEQKAETANELLAEQVKKAQLDNENYTSPKDMMALKSQQSPTANPDSKLMKDDSDKSPDQQNEDKKIRTAKNAFNAVVLGLEDYRVKVLTQKSEKYKDLEELTNNVVQWETEKFYPLVQSSMVNWKEILPEMSSFNSVEDINQDTWLTLVSECKGEKLEAST